MPIFLAVITKCIDPEICNFCVNSLLQQLKMIARLLKSSLIWRHIGGTEWFGELATLHVICSRGGSRQ